MADAFIRYALLCRWRALWTH